MLNASLTGNESGEIPVFYFTQLIALAFGLGEKAAALSKNMIDPKPLLRSKELV
jgi:heterodisulfide reductase subunit B